MLPESRMKAVRPVRVEPKNRPMPKTPTITVNSRGFASSRAGAWTTVPSPCRSVVRPLGCRAKAETKSAVSTAAPIIGAAGDIVVASRPTMTGPKTKIISSAADS
ncbi:hypothetical protein MTP03_34790 [Tsukamurella sp. PLM1]|nr:hypothetical protein MTP03_34790 [Tsukamurella sp. PLM1]